MLKKFAVVAPLALAVLVAGGCSSTSQSVDSAPVEQAVSDELDLSAAPPHPNGEAVAISMGDSFISGEGARFAGNVYAGTLADSATDNFPNNRGLDVYRGPNSGPTSGDSYLCHRSDSAEIVTAAAALNAKPVNLACSGAETKNLLNTSYRGEAPQLDQLRKIANDNSKNIRLIALSIGGNDLGFSSVIADCIQVALYHDCGNNGTFDKYFASRKDQVVNQVKNVLNTTTNIMREAGYQPGSYRFIYQSAPQLFAARDYRFPSGGISAYDESPGVPMSGATVQWTRDKVVPWINATFQEAIRQSDNPDIQQLNLTKAFNGHELSSKDTEFLNTAVRPWMPLAATAEWVVPLNSNYIAGQVAKTQRQQETYHPNYFGQLALGNCLAGALKYSNKEIGCEGFPEKGPEQVAVFPM